LEANNALPSWASIFILERKKTNPSRAPFLTIAGKKFIETISLRCG
jgi:hypothetical protein